MPAARGPGGCSWYRGSNEHVNIWSSDTGKVLLRKEAIATAETTSFVHVISRRRTSFYTILCTEQIRFKGLQA
eukprot:50241-Eustigmatos_ZCMA.PRE.1